MNNNIPQHSTMRRFVFLCDREWTIKKILQHPSDSLIHEEDFLPDLLLNPEDLPDKEAAEENIHRVTALKLRGIHEKLTALICTFPKYYLLYLGHVRNQQEFEDFIACYAEYFSWAEENLKIPYEDEYFQIQQMNNQLINSQRALMKNKRRLEQVLKEIREAHNTIALLEQDELTNLYCASAFYTKVQALLQTEPDTKYDIIVLDIDKFKLVNETFGMESGNHFLKSLALTLTGLPDADHGIIARATADVFYLCMPEELHFYTTLKAAVSDFLEQYPLPIKLQEKVSVYPVDDLSLSVEQMCDRARLALTFSTLPYSEIAFYDHKLHEKLIRDHQILNSIQEAFEEHQFLLYLQPKVDIATRRIIGAESLIRWKHPVLGWVRPDEFIPLLEKNDLIYNVDKFIWEETCRFLHNRREQGLPEIPVSVNVSRGDLYQKDLRKVLGNLLDKYQLDPRLLHLEIIERAYVKDPSTISQILSQLRADGFLLEMDDFGTGESSLNMLSEFPVDCLKLDRSFLIRGLHDKRHIEVVRFIINLAHMLDLAVIAEGVETQEQADLLLSLGCTHAQGYFYCRPEPVENFPQDFQL